MCELDHSIFMAILKEGLSVFDYNNQVNNVLGSF